MYDVTGNLAVEKGGNYSLLLIPTALIIGLLIGHLAGPIFQAYLSPSSSSFSSASEKRNLATSCCAARGQDPFSPDVCAELGRPGGTEAHCCDGANRYLTSPSYVIMHVMHDA